jgi:pimeloyl-ACP methyl ester carboxylesterase
MKSVKLWLQRFALGLLGFFILFLIFTFVYARIKDEWVLTHPPENSMFVYSGERKLYLHAKGLEHEGPAIVLLPGFLGNSSAWSIVQPELAKTNRVYAFDLAGFAWSDPPPDPLTPGRIADDLHAVLPQLGEKEIILVGFSGGALSVYNYYHRYSQQPPQIIGLVWAEGDAMIPEEMAGYNGKLPFPLPESLRPFIIESGIYRLLADTLVAQEKERIPKAAQPLVDWDYLNKTLATMGTRQTAYTAFDMLAAFPEEVQYTADLPLSTGVPVFVLQADYGPDFASLENEQEKEELRQLQSKRAEWFHKFAESTPGGRYIPIANSGHLIVWEQPQAVIKAIKDMIELVKK